MNLTSNACNQQFIAELTVFLKNIFVPNTSTGVDNLIIVINIPMILQLLHTTEHIIRATTIPSRPK